MRNVSKYLLLMVVGGLLYCLFEILYRGYTHWSMFLVGGICFLICGELNEWFTFRMSLLLQGIICACFVTAVEFFSGCILNLLLKLNIWNYGNMPFNLFGQICLPFSLLWILVGMLAVVVDDYLRYLFFDEEKPHYTIL